MFMVFVGSAATLGLLVAPILFKSIDSRDLAGRVFGNILTAWVFVAAVCVVVLVITAAITARRVRQNRRLVLGRLLALVPAAVLLGIFGWVMSRINTIQSSLTQPIQNYPANQNPRLEFDQLHSVSTNLVSGAILFGLLWFGLSVVLLVRVAQPRRAEAVAPVLHEVAAADA